MAFSLGKIRGMNLTKGNLFLKLFVFALPIAFTTILQLLYTNVDLITVHFGESQEASSAILATHSLINLIICVFSGMSLGSNVAIGNAKGANDKEKAERIFHTSLIFSIFLGICVGVMGFFISPYILEAMGTEKAYMANATTYLRIYFIGLPFLMVYNYSAQMLRSIGDSTTPFLILLISGLINVGADLILVNVMHLGVAGAAFATIFSEAISSILAILIFIFKKNSYLRLKLKKLHISRKELGEIIELGLPSGLNSFFFALPNVFIQSALYQVGAGNIDLISGAIAAEALNGYCYAFVEATSSATMSMTAQNYGALNKENIKKAHKYGLIWVSIFTAIYAILILTLNRPLLSLFIDKGNEESYKAGRDRLLIVGITYILDGIMDVNSGTMKGVRHSLPPAIITILTCTVTRIILIETLILRVPFFKTVTWLYSLYPISWTLAILAQVIVMPKIMKKEYHHIDIHKAMGEKDRIVQSQRFI